MLTFVGWNFTWWISTSYKSSHRRCSVKKVFLEIWRNIQENTCVKVSFFNNFIKKETLAQMFSCQFCEISKNTFFTEHLWTTASVVTRKAVLNS